MSDRLFGGEIAHNNLIHPLLRSCRLPTAPCRGRRDPAFTRANTDRSVDAELKNREISFLTRILGRMTPICIFKYKTPKRETAKSIAIDALRELSREEISALIDERLSYVMNKVKVLETHFVSGTFSSIADTSRNA